MTFTTNDRVAIVRAMVIGLALFGIGLVVIWLFHLGVFGTYLTGFILGGVAYALRQS